MFNEYEIQRYLDEDKLCKFIDDNGLYFNRINNFPLDPTEGDGEYFGKLEQDIVKALYPKIVQAYGHMPYNDFEQLSKKKAEELHDSNKNFIFIQSWFQDRKTSIAMWNEYAKYQDNPNCALIVTDTISLGNAIDLHFPIGNAMKKVSYVIDKYRERDNIFTKEKKFTHEKEYRLSLDLKDLGLFNPTLLELLNFDENIVASFRHQKATNPSLGQYYRNNGIALESSFSPRSKTGFVVNIPINDFVKKIYIPSKASDNFFELIVRKLKDKNYNNIECIRLNIDSD